MERKAVVARVNAVPMRPPPRWLEVQFDVASYAGAHRIEQHRIAEVRPDRSARAPLENDCVPRAVGRMERPAKPDPRSPLRDKIRLAWTLTRRRSFWLRREYLPRRCSARHVRASPLLL